MDDRDQEMQEIREEMESEGIRPTDDAVEDRWQEQKREERKRDR